MSNAAEKLYKDISEFVMLSRSEFPEIVGFGIRMEPGTEKLSFLVLTAREMSLGEQREFFQHFGDRFIKFDVTGDIVVAQGVDTEKAPKDVVIREKISIGDIRDLLSAGWPGIGQKELLDYENKYFEKDGSRKQQIANPQSDTILLAEIGSKIVGYLHFYSDKLEYDKIENKYCFVACSFDPELDYKKKEEIRNIFRKIYPFLRLI